MMTTIAWTHFTYNLWHGCVKVGPACKNCYAETMSKRWKRDIWGPSKPRHFQKDSYYDNPYKWQRKAAKLGVAYRVFCMSMGDLFEIHPNPEIDQQMSDLRATLMQQIYHTPNLVYMLLTKRPENIGRLYPTVNGRVQFPKNVWLGVSVGTNKQAYRIAQVSRHDAGGYFVSFEPLLEMPNLKKLLPIMYRSRVGENWTLIAGGESGVKARKAEIPWFYAVQELAEHTDSNFFMKQYGAKLAKEMGLKHSKGEDPTEWPPGLQVQNVPDYRFPWGDKAV